MVNQVCVQLAIPYLNAFYKRTGPMYVPGKSACFHCYEASLREEIGDLHDMIVNALQKNKQWHYPSIVFGPLQTGLLQAQECLAYLSGAWEPLSLGAVVFTDPDTSTRRLPIPIRQDCSVCSQSGAHTLQTKGGKEEDQ
jgi:hypothetical protein